MKEEKKWYVIHTKSKLEKRTVEIFEKKQILVYLPEYSKIQYLNGKQKLIKTLLLPSIFFAFLNEEQLKSIMNISGVAGILYRLQEPAVIKNSEIDALQNFLITHNGITVEKIPIATCNKFNSSYFHNLEKVPNNISYEAEKLFLTSLGYCITSTSRKILSKVA